MSAAALFRRATAAGFRLTRKGGSIRCEPEPPAKLAAALSRNRLALLQLLDPSNERGMANPLAALPTLDDDADCRSPARPALARPQIPLAGEPEAQAEPVPRPPDFIPGVNYLNEMSRLAAAGLRADTPGYEPVEVTALRLGYRRTEDGRWQVPWQHQ